MDLSQLTVGPKIWRSLGACNSYASVPMTGSWSVTNTGDGVDVTFPLSLIGESEAG